MMTMQSINAFRRRQAGYSLVELGIVVVVVGIMVSGLIVPLGAELRAKNQDKVARQLSEAVDAIIGYAVVNRSPGALYRHHDLNRASGQDGKNFYGYRLTRIPSGRPYLPCPDTNGDGIENRGQLQVPVATYPLGIDGNSSNRHILRDSSAADSAGIDTAPFPLPMISVGRCARAYGALPWRTLGLKPSDPWGNGFTYYVSGRFSTGLLGFDQLTRSSFLNDQVEVNFPDGNSSGVSAASSSLDSIPVFVCDPGVITTSQRCSPERDLNTASQAHTRRTAQLSASHALYAYSMVRSHAIGGAFDGLPFAIISHGPNGKGAISSFGDISSCKSFLGVAPIQQVLRRDAEVMNSVYGLCSSMRAPGAASLDDQVNINGNPGFESDPGAGAAPDEDYPYQYGYVYALGQANAVAHAQRVQSVNQDNSPLDGFAGEFDDSVAWLTRRELVARLMDLGILPVEQPFRGFLSAASQITLP